MVGVSSRRFNPRWKRTAGDWWEITQRLDRFPSQGPFACRGHGNGNGTKKMLPHSTSRVRNIWNPWLMRRQRRAHLWGRFLWRGNAEYIRPLAWIMQAPETKRESTNQERKEEITCWNFHQRPRSCVTSSQNRATAVCMCEIERDTESWCVCVCVHE